MKGIQRSLLGTLVAGAIVIVPVYLSVLLLKAMGSVTGLVKPVALLLPDWLPGEELMALLLVLLVCPLVGLLVRTAAGQAVRERVERSLFERNIPREGAQTVALTAPGTGGPTIPRQRTDKEGATSMRRLRIAWLTGALLATAAGAFAQADDLTPFPAPETGMHRVVIRLPVVPNPDDHKVEVLIGKTIEVNCNRQAFGATVTRQVAQGWGFPYYVVGPLTGPMSTQMACPPGFVNRNEFVRAHAEELAWLRYNPRLPLVLYVPAGVEVRYRLWRAGDTLHDARIE